MGESYDGRAAVPSISREGVTQKSCDRYTKYYKSHGAVCLFRSQRRHGVHGAPCDWGITRRATGARLFCLKMIVDNVAVTPVYALWHITMCVVYVS